MTFDETFIVIAVAALAAWALYSMRRTMRDYANRQAALADFAKTKRLVGTTVQRAPGEFDSNTPITWKAIKKAWSRNPAVVAPVRGSAMFTGTNNGFPFVMDEVWIKKYWTNLRDVYLRMAVELPGLPATLAVSPARGIGQLARGAGSAPRPADRARGANLTIRFSAAASEQAQERSYLTAHRVHLLQEFEETLGGVYVNDGKLLVIRRRRIGDRVDLNTLYDGLGKFARMLAE